MAAYSFTGEVWIADAQDPWHFVTLPPDVADEIAEHAPATGFGSVRVEASIGGVTWATSLFPDKRAGSYLLPLKAAIREAVEIAAGDRVDVTLKLASAGRED